MVKDAEIMEIRQRLDVMVQCLNRLEGGGHSPDKTANILESLSRQLELSCIAARRLTERRSPPVCSLEAVPGHSDKMEYGEAGITDAGWLHIRLSFLLPNHRFLSGTQYVSDSILRLLYALRERTGKLPYYDKAFIAVIEHCNYSNRTCFDNDNKGYQAVINALKGRIFADDNQFELSLGLFTEFDDELSCHVYVLPDTDVGEFCMKWQEGEL